MTYKDGVEAALRWILDGESPFIDEIKLNSVCVYDAISAGRTTSACPLFSLHHLAWYSFS
ncbi:MAG: hypothetical protein ACQ9MH_10630 [Nitrospinales bacterium]